MVGLKYRILMISTGCSGNPELFLCSDFHCFHIFFTHKPVLSSRSCDSTFGLGVCKEDELGWLSSADDLGGSGDVLKSDVKFPCPEQSEVENISENHDFSNGYSLNNSAMTSAPIRYKDSSWTSEKSDSYRSLVIGPDIDDSKDGFIPQEQVTIYICYLNHASVLLRLSHCSVSLETQFITDVMILQGLGFNGKIQPRISTNSHFRTGSAAVVSWKFVIV